MSKTGKYNAITDVEGIKVGHYSHQEALSGVTVVLCPHGAVAGVDVRGAAPGGRETDLLDPVNLVQKVQAVTLSGGSVYGIRTADGVIDYLAQKGLGFPLQKGQVAPIVPGAVLFDLGRGAFYPPPISLDWGHMACEAASSGPVSMGCVGAGAGAVSGGLKGGLGTASEVLPSGITVGALAAVNSLGSGFNPMSGLAWEAGLEMEGEFEGMAAKAKEPPPSGAGEPSQNTTIGVVAVDARLNKPQAKKLAQMAHDGLARAIRPAHTMFDGDTIFCLATGQKDLPQVEGFFDAASAQAINKLGRAAADCFSRAVMHALFSAVSMAGFTAWRDLPDKS